MKTRNLFVALFVALLALVVVSPVLAAGITPYEPSGTGTFCTGTGPLVFESSVPDGSWECKNEGTYSVIQPWHSPGGPYNPTYRKDGLSWKQAIAEFDQAGLNSGSIWFVPAKGASAPGDNGPAAPTANPFSLENLVASYWWTFCCPMLLLLVALALGAFLFNRRRNRNAVVVEPANE